MKKSFILFLFISCLMACNSNTSKLLTDTTESAEVTLSAQEYLTIHLEKLPGVRIYGNGQNVTVNVSKSAGQYTNDCRPLYVVDGMELGKNFYDVSQLVEDKDIKSVKMLKHSELAMYYKRFPEIPAAILITTK